MSHADSLHRFLFEHSNVRGEHVHLDATWSAVLSKYDYPEPARKVLGEAMVAAALLAETIKFNGKLTLQISSKGPLSMLVVQCSSGRTLRGTCDWHDLPDDISFKDMMPGGYLAITIEPEEGERYQGIVPVEGENLAGCINQYFEQSEQLPTTLWLAADNQRAAGLLLQQLPGETKEDDLWSRVNHLAETVQAEELLGLDVQTVLHRLFHEEEVRLFEPSLLSFGCSCSRDRVAEALLQMGQHEVETLLKEQGEVSSECHFCKSQYLFDAVDVAALFAEGVKPEGSETRQ